MTKYNSQETIFKITSTASTLFISKGYDNTSIQDIINGAGMSKGAIYHHFESKEDILQAILHSHGEDIVRTMHSYLKDNQSLTAKEKLRGVLRKNWGYIESHQLEDMMLSQNKNAPFILGALQVSLKRSAPLMADIMREGKSDGSLSVQYPEECAAVFFLLINFWCDPILIEGSINDLEKRLKFLQHLMETMGADIVEDEMIDHILRTYTHAEHDQEGQM